MDVRQVVKKIIIRIIIKEKKTKKKNKWGKSLKGWLSSALHVTLAPGKRA